MSNYFLKQSRLSGQSTDPKIYVQLSSESDKTSWSTGNSATWGSSGSVAGAWLAKNYTSPLNSYSSYSFVMAAGSLNDWVQSDLISVPLRSRGVTNRTKLVYTYDGNDNDIKWIVYDVTNSTIVTPSTAYVVTSSVGKQVELIYDLPVTCTQVRFGFQVLVANNTKVLKFDDVQMSDEPFTTANLVINEAIKYTGYTSGTTSGIKLKTLMQSSSSNILSSDNTGSYTKLAILKSCQGTVVANLSVNTTGTYSNIERYNSIGTLIETSEETVAGTTYSPAVITGFFNTGDYFIFKASKTPFDDTRTNFSITASAISSNIIQTWQDGTEWKSLTYTDVNNLTGNQGLGSFTAGGVEWMRGKDGLLHYKGKLTIGGYTTSEIRIPYPAGLIAAGVDKIPSIQIAGIVGRSASSTYLHNILTEPNVGYFMIGSGISGSLAKMTGNQFGANGEQFSFNFTVPIAGWSSSPTILALPTATQTDYYLEAAGNAGQSITANVTDIPFIAVTNNNLIWDGSGFTAPISGNYEVMGFAIENSSHSGVIINAYVNGVATKNMSYQAAASARYPISGKIYLTAGQRLSLRSDTNLTLSNTAVSHHISITRLNGKNDSVLVGNVARNQIAYIKDVKANGTNGGTFTSGAWQTRDLNTISGDSTIVSLAANVFTLQAGEYDIEVEAPAFCVNQNQSGIALNGSSTPDVVVGTSVYANSTTPNSSTSFSRIRLSVSTTTSYKVLHRCQASKSSEGFGTPTSFGINEVYTQVKITKLNGQ